jgi:hypothetical protein
MYDKSVKSLIEYLIHTTNTWLHAIDHTPDLLSSFLLEVLPQGADIMQFGLYQHAIKIISSGRLSI